MKRPILLALTTLTLCSSAALADSFGLRLGSPLGVQYTIDNGFARNTDLRIAGYVNPFYGALQTGVQVDALTDRPLGDNRDLSLFYGGGANLELVSSGSFSAFGVGVQGTGGISYRLDSNVSLFADVSVGLSFYSGSFINRFSGIGPYYGGALGINFRL